MTELLRQHLQKAQQRMKKQADKQRSEHAFQVGDQVFLKVQPYPQTSVAGRVEVKIRIPGRKPLFYINIFLLTRLGVKPRRKGCGMSCGGPTRGEGPRPQDAVASSIEPGGPNKSSRRRPAARRGNKEVEHGQEEGRRISTC